VRCPRPPADARASPAAGQETAARVNLPRTADGARLGGIWQARNTAAADLLAHAAKLHMPAGSAVSDNDIPNSRGRRHEDRELQNRAPPTAGACLCRRAAIMYLDFPDLQTPNDRDDLEW
jgi:hypothetical protein